MTDQAVIDAKGTTVNEGTIRSFQSHVEGPVLRPSSAGYDDVRKVWNGMIDNRPALIVRCAGARDVALAIDFARTHDLVLAVHGGGHNIAGRSMAEGSLVVDLSLMKGLEVDVAKRRARADAGLTLGEFDRGVHPHGLITTLGINTTTGIAGLTLGGGYGWLAGKLGMTCDNLLAAEMVTAEGRVVTASASENEDLFWGLRGGGGNFGVVTQFEYRLHPLQPVLAGRMLYPNADAPEVLRFYRDFAAEAPDELTTVFAFLTSPEGTPVVAIVVCYFGSPTEGEKVLAPLHAFGSPLADEVGPMSYLDVQRMLDAVFPFGQLYYWKTCLLPELGDEAMEAAIEASRRRPSPLTAIPFQQLHGAATRVDANDTAFAHRYDHYNCIPTSIWLDSANNDENIDWARRYFDAMQPYATGIYANDLGEHELDAGTAESAAERLAAAYGAKTQERLVALKNKYDPSNFFRLNANIRPSR